MKLNMERLEQLIMEELRTLKEFKITTNPAPKIKDLYQDLGMTKADLYTAATKGGEGASSSGAKKAAASLGAISGDSTAIDNGDFATAKGKASGNKDRKFADYVQQKSSNSAFATDWNSTVASSWTKIPISASMGKNPLKAAIKSVTKHLATNPTDSDAIDNLGEMVALFAVGGGLYTKHTSGIAAKYSAAQTLYNALKGGSPTALQKLSDVLLDMTFAAAGVKTMKRKDRADKVGALDVNYTSHAQSGAFKKIAIKEVDQSTVDVMETFFRAAAKYQGNFPAQAKQMPAATTTAQAVGAKGSVEGRLQLLAAFANDIKKASGTGASATAAKNRITSLLSEEEILACAIALKTFGGVFYGTGKSEAGVMWETFIAMMTAGAIVGGDSGAIDNFSGYMASDRSYFSAKAITKAGAQKPGTTQAIGPWNSQGLGRQATRATVDGEAIWYFSLAKRETSDMVAKLDLYGVGVQTASDNSGTLTTTLSQSDAQFWVHINPLDGTVIENSTGINWGTGQTWTGTPHLVKMATIPIVKSVGDIRNIDQMISTGLDKLGSQFISTARLINQRIANVKKDFTSFSATDDHTQAIAAVQSFVKEFNDAKKGLKAVLDVGGTAASKGKASFADLSSTERAKYTAQRAKLEENQKKINKIA